MVGVFIYFDSFINNQRTLADLQIDRFGNKN